MKQQPKNKKNVVEFEISTAAEAIEADTSFREAEAFAQAHGLETASQLFHNVEHSTFLKTL